MLNRVARLLNFVTTQDLNRWGYRLKDNVVSIVDNIETEANKLLNQANTHINFDQLLEQANQVQEDLKQNSDVLSTELIIATNNNILVSEVICKVSEDGSFYKTRCVIDKYVNMDSLPSDVAHIIKQTGNVTLKVF